MTVGQRKELVQLYLGKRVSVTIDRPIGYEHHTDKGTIVYPLNYGYIPYTTGGDDEPLDVYLLGVEEKVDACQARVIAMIHRENDVEDKLVAAPEGILFTEQQIRDAVWFQEQYFDIRIETCDIRYYTCTAHNGCFEGLPDDVLQLCREKICVPLGGGAFKLYTYEAYEKMMEMLNRLEDSVPLRRRIAQNACEIEDTEGLFWVIVHSASNPFADVSDDISMQLRVVVVNEAVEVFYEL